MLLLEIQENVIKAQNALRNFESNFVYKVFKTFGNVGDVELELRKILNDLIDLRNSLISHTESIIRISENKDLLRLIDTGYFDRYADAVSRDSFIRIVSVGDFRMPQTSMEVVAENRLVITELQSINAEIKAYNDRITDFRQKRNKFFLTLYHLPYNNELPDIIYGTVNLEGVLPNAQFLNDYPRNRELATAKSVPIAIELKNETGKIKITKKEPGNKLNKVIITKKK